MPRGASNKWHNDSLKADIAEILLTLDKGDCFTRFTLARMLYALEYISPTGEYVGQKDWLEIAIHRI